MDRNQNGPPRRQETKEVPRPRLRVSRASALTSESGGRLLAGPKRRHSHARAAGEKNHTTMHARGYVKVKFRVRLPPNASHVALTSLPIRRMERSAGVDGRRGEAVKTAPALLTGGELHVMRTWRWVLDDDVP